MSLIFKTNCFLVEKQVNYKLNISVKCPTKNKISCIFLIRIMKPLTFRSILLCVFDFNFDFSFFFS